MNKPKPTHFTTHEGGPWHGWYERNVLATRLHGHLSNYFHAIKFSDGSIFDMVNGWREEEPQVDPLVKTLILRLADAVEAVQDNDLINDFRSNVAKNLRRSVE